MRVLLIEDDQSTAKSIELMLKSDGYVVDTTDMGEDGLEIGKLYEYDIIILDLMLPDLDGYEVLKRLRAAKVETPILILSGLSELDSKLKGLGFGADDYLTKPFSIREFIARVKVIFRRKEDNSALQDATPAASVITYGNLEIDLDKRKVTLNNMRVELSPREFELMALLASNPGKSYSRKRLLNLVWGYDFEGYEHTVNSHINRLRGKIEDDVSNPKYILTTWGVGYRFNEEL